MATVTVTRPDGSSFDADVNGDVKAMPDDQRAQLFHDILQADAQRRASQPDTGFGSGFRYGLAQPLQGAADTADVAGATDIGNTLRGAAKSVAPTNYSPAMPEVSKNLAAGNYRDAASYVPRAITEGLGSGLGYIGAGAAGAAMGGEMAGPAGAVVGGLAAPFAASVATNYGSHVKSRAAEGGRTTPNEADYLGPIPGTLGEAALNTVGAGAGPIGKAVTGVLPGILKPAGRMALDAAGTGLADVADQQARGNPTFDPYESLGAAAQGAGARGVTEVQGAVKGAAGALGDRIAASQLPDIPNPEAAASRDRVLTEFQKAQQDSKAFGDNLPDTKILNNIKQSKAALVRGLATQLRDDGYIEPDEFNTLVRPAMEQAQRHNNTLTDGPGTPFGDLQALNIPADRLQPLINGLRDLNTVSDQTLIKNTRGGFQTLGNWMGQLGGIGAAALTGDHAALIGAALGHSLLGKLGGNAGAVIDRMMGTNKAPISLQAQQVQRILQQAGIASGDSSNQQMLDALSKGRDDRASLVAQLGMMGAKAAQYTPSPDLHVNMTPEQVQALPSLQQAHLADMAGVSLNELQQGAQQGLTPAQVVKGRDLTEKAANTVGGMAKRNNQWPNPQVSEANFVNTNGEAGAPNTGYTTPGYVKGNTIVGGWRSVRPGEVFQPGQKFRMNTSTGQSEVFDSSLTQQTEQAVNQAMQEAGMELNGQEMRSAHASQMAIKAAGNQNLRSSLNGGNGPDPVAQAKATTAANGPPSGNTARGWKAAVQMGARDHGFPAEVPEIHSALDTLAANGHLNDLFPDGVGAQGAAQMLKQHSEPLRGPIGREVIRRVTAQVAADKGMSHKLDHEAVPGSQAPPGAAVNNNTGPIQDPVRHQMANQDIHAVAGRVAGQLSALAQHPGMEGLHNTAALVNNLVSPAMKRTVDKQRAVAAHLATLTPPQRTIAQGILSNSPGLMTGRP